MIIIDYGAKAREARNLHHNVARILARASIPATVIGVDQGWFATELAIHLQRVIDS